MLFVAGDIGVIQLLQVRPSARYLMRKKIKGLERVSCKQLLGSKAKLSLPEQSVK